jgi:hypothetical protein
MNIQLIKGEFKAIDALELISQLILTKIKYHENKITQNCTEEDVKYRESKIKSLQKELSDLRSNLNGKVNNLKIETLINIEN